MKLLRSFLNIPILLLVVIITIIHYIFQFIELFFTVTLIKPIKFLVSRSKYLVVKLLNFIT